MDSPKQRSQQANLVSQRQLEAGFRLRLKEMVGLVSNYTEAKTGPRCQKAELNCQAQDTQ